MQISKARRTGRGTCGRCNGSGLFGVGCSQDSAGNMVAGVCYRCGGNGLEPTGFEGQTVNATVMQSVERRDGQGRRGTIDVVAVVDTYATPKVRGKSGCVAVTEIRIQQRVVGRMVDGTTFDKTIKAASMSTADLLAFEALEAQPSRRIRAGLGVMPLNHWMTEAEERAVLVDLGVIA